MQKGLERASRYGKPFPCFFILNFYFYFFDEIEYG